MVSFTLINSDLAVLENYHVASAFQLINQNEFNFLAGLRED